MKLLITGAGGQLGKEWVEFCTLNNIPFEAFDSKSLDISDGAGIQKVCKKIQPDVFINCAAYTKVDQAEDEPELAELVNSKAVAEISNVCKELDIKLVHYSTDYVFGGSPEDQKNLPEGYPEDFKTSPINVYGATKCNGEEAIINSGCNFLLLRVSWLCGKYGHNFIKTMIRLGQEREELNIVNDQYGSPTFADQVVEQSFQLLAQKESGIFHLSSNGLATWFDFANEIFQLKEIDVNVLAVDSKAFKTKAKRPAFSKLNTKKMSTIPTIKILSWQEGLKNIINTI